MSTQTIAVKVNERALLHNLQHAFTDKTTVIGELIQNSRRAGATQIEITINNDCLIVKDDGAGINNMQDLLTVADSGWSKETKENESPYGMGFLACLYSGDEVVVESNGKKVQLITKDVVDFKPVEVMGSEVTTGTIVTIKCNTELFSDNREAIQEKFFNGFSLPITLNGKQVARPHAIDKLGFYTLINATCGKVSLALNHFYCIYLQGILVDSYSPAVYGNTDLALKFWTPS